MTVTVDFALERAPTAPRIIIMEAAELLEPIAVNAGIAFATDIAQDVSDVDADRMRLLQVLSNLVGNALKFTPAGGRVDVRLEPTGDGARLVVADTGAGIDPAELPFVFERFYRGAEAHESRAAGSGLGLSIVRSIVEMHNGRVSISSTPGQGTRVSVSLPRDVSVSSSPAGRAPSPRGAPPRRSSGEAASAVSTQ